MELAPGAFHLPRFLSIDEQRALVDHCRALLDGPVPAYVPTVRGGGKMHVRMLCLGRHWNGKTYRYEPTRADYDDLPAPPLPGRISPARRPRRVVCRHGDRRRPLHHEFLRGGRPHGASSGQGRKRAVARRGRARRLDLARRHRAIPVRRARAVATRSNRSCSSQATPSCSAARPGSGITACRASFAAPRRPSSRIDGRFNLTFRQYDVDRDIGT